MAGPDYRRGIYKEQLVNYIGWLFDHPKYGSDIKSRVNDRFGNISKKNYDTAYDLASEMRSAAKLINKRKADSTFNLDVVPAVFGKVSIFRVQLTVNLSSISGIDKTTRGYTFDLDTIPKNKKELIAEVAQKIFDDIRAHYSNRKSVKAVDDIYDKIKITSVGKY